MPYQDSIGRNTDVGGSPSAGLLLTDGCADRVGLSVRVRVVGELARVQPGVARIAANKRTMDERVAMVSILTSSPESESRETSPRGVREPSGHARPYRAVGNHRQNVGGKTRYCRAYCPDIRLQ